jgi:hypothetical protein
VQALQNLMGHAKITATMEYVYGDVAMIVQAIYIQHKA